MYLLKCTVNGDNCIPRQKYTLGYQNTLFQHWEYTFAPLGVGRSAKDYKTIFLKMEMF